MNGDLCMVNVKLKKERHREYLRNKERRGRYRKRERKDLL
jgi:hypothetical protein